MKVLITILLVAACESSNILGIFSHAGKSHHILGETLLKALAKKGHNVTMASPFPLITPFQNYKDIDIFETRNDMEARHKSNSFQNMINRSIWNMYGAQFIKNMTLTQTDLLFKNKELKNLSKTEKFDLVIIDLFFNEAHLVYGHIFKCPIILLSSSGSSVLTNYITGNPEPYSYVPSKYGILGAKMNFVQRAKNTFAQISYSLYTLLEIYSFQQNILDKHFPRAPKIEKLFDQVALILCNSHYSFESVRPFVPNIINVGGFHIQKAKPLPSDLQIFMDEAKTGIIFFSLGSHMKSVYLGDETVKEILVAFAKLNMKVIWKFENQTLQVPENVLIRKWLPQNDILAHTNTKLFITHGGLLSTIESLYHKVPMIGIPIFGDQDSNIANNVEMGYALKLSRKDITAKSLHGAIIEILSSSKYLKAVKLNSHFLREQPIEPMAKAIYWIDHVIKHKGAEHLKNGSMSLAWYQYMLLDIATMMIAIILILLAFVYYCVRYIVGVFYYKNVVNTKRIKIKKP